MVYYGYMTVAQAQADIPNLLMAGLLQAAMPVPVLLPNCDPRDAIEVAWQSCERALRILLELSGMSRPTATAAATERAQRVQHEATDKGRLSRRRSHAAVSKLLAQLQAEAAEAEGLDDTLAVVQQLLHGARTALQLDAASRAYQTEPYVGTLEEAACRALADGTLAGKVQQLEQACQAAVDAARQQGLGPAGQVAAMWTCYAHTLSKLLGIPYACCEVRLDANQLSQPGPPALHRRLAAAGAHLLRAHQQRQQYAPASGCLDLLHFFE